MAELSPTRRLAELITATGYADIPEQQLVEAERAIVDCLSATTLGLLEPSSMAFRVLLKHFGIDEFEFFRKTEATFKLGIRHEDWRRKGFTYYGPIDDPHQVVQPPKGAPSDYLNVYAIAAGRPRTPTSASRSGRPTARCC